MKLLLLALSVISVTLAKHNPIIITCIPIHGECHKMEVLINGLDRPYQLSHSHHNHTTYFSYSKHPGKAAVHKVGYIKGQQNYPTDIPEIINGFATAIDQKNNIAYFGGSHTIMKQHLSHNESLHLVVNGTNIWDMFFKEHLYFITYPKLRLYKHLGDGETERQKHINEKIYQFVIDGEDDTFITNKTGLYMIKNNTNHRILITGANIFRAVEVNNKGVAHFCGQNDIFVANKHNHTLEKILDVPNIFGLTFDHEDNIIYSDPHQIVRLEPELIVPLSINQTEDVMKIVKQAVNPNP